MASRWHPWLSSLQNNPYLENSTPTECLSGQYLVKYFVWEHISKVVQQSGNSQEIEYVSIGPPAYIADQPLGEIIFSIKWSAHQIKLFLKYTVALKWSNHMGTSSMSHI